MSAGMLATSVGVSGNLVCGSSGGAAGGGGGAGGGNDAASTGGGVGSSTFGKGADATVSALGNSTEVVGAAGPLANCSHGSGCGVAEIP